MFNKKKSDLILLNWDMLVDEQKVKMVELALNNTEITVSGCCGDVETLTISGFDRFNEGRVIVKTTDKFYSTLILSDKYIIEKWQQHIKTLIKIKKGRNNMKEGFQYG